MKQQDTDPSDPKNPGEAPMPVDPKPDETGPEIPQPQEPSSPVPAPEIPTPDAPSEDPPPTHFNTDHGCLIEQKTGTVSVFLSGAIKPDLWQIF